MKIFFKNNYKFFIGLIVGLIISGVGAYAITQIAASVVTYDNATSGLEASTAQEAIDELYTLHTQGDASASDILTGKTAISNGTVLTGTMAKPTTATGNAYSGAVGNLSGSTSLTTSTALTLANYKSNDKYNFVLGNNEQITFSPGFYEFPINVSNGGKSVSNLSQATLIGAIPGSGYYTFSQDYDMVVAASSNNAAASASYSGRGTVLVNNSNYTGANSMNVAVAIILNVKAGDSIYMSWAGSIYSVR